MVNLIVIMPNCALLIGLPSLGLPQFLIPSTTHKLDQIDLIPNYLNS